MQFFQLIYHLHVVYLMIILWIYLCLTTQIKNLSKYIYFSSYAGSKYNNQRIYIPVNYKNFNRKSGHLVYAKVSCMVPGFFITDGMT